MNIPVSGLACVLAAMAMIASPTELVAEGNSKYDLTGRFNAVGGTGEPSNDILGFGVVLHRRLSDEWYLGFGIDVAHEFDVETPNELLDIDGVGEVDALGTMILLTALAERRYAFESSNWSAFWNLGFGIASVDVDDADGAVEGGGRYDIEIDADTETVLVGGVGLMQRLGENWSMRYEATVEQHFADWEVSDRVSGASDSYDDYTVSGLRLGLNYRF